MATWLGIPDLDQVADPQLQGGAQQYHAQCREALGLLCQHDGRAEEIKMLVEEKEAAAKPMEQGTGYGGEPVPIFRFLTASQN